MGVSFVLVTFPLPAHQKQAQLGLFLVFGASPIPSGHKKHAHFGAFFVSLPSPPFEHQLHIHMDALLVFGCHHHPIQASKCVQNGVLLVYGPPSHPFPNENALFLAHFCDFFIYLIFLCHNYFI